MVLLPPAHVPPHRKMPLVSLLACGLLLSALTPAAAQDSARRAQAREFHVGIATVDVTPAESIRLTGYAVRKTNSAGVEQKLWAKAIAIGNDLGSSGPEDGQDARPTLKEAWEGRVRRAPSQFALLMTLDNCGIAEGTYRELLRRLARHGIKQEQLALCMSHTHAGPCTTDWAPNIFAQDIPAEQRATIDRYTQSLLDRLEKVATDALKDSSPAHISWSRGKVDFARNRRTAGGPVDHDLPALKITAPDGKLRALVANYACHCTTLGGEFNHTHGDWAGCAQEALEREHPGATALVTIGCGADANPHPRGGKDGGLALANQHGESLAGEIKRMLALTFRPLAEPLTASVKEVRLPFDAHFTRQQWEARANEQGIVGYHARKFLARLERGEDLPADLYYPIVTWHFGDDLGLVFLPGEVVVDYSVRLKKELEAEKLWISAYANYVPCYIPSRRILKEGGYEAESSLWYYDRPARLAPDTEDLIIKTVHDLLPKTYKVDEKRAQLPPPRTPAQSLHSIRTHAELQVELAVAEPLVQSPVSIDWSADGRLWVCEMFDYPTGLDGEYKPGGRIKVLSDTDRSGKYKTATVFLDGLPFPTGVMPWRKGAFICAAPDILYAEDTNSDGRADVVTTNFTGFATHNYQARVNGLTWGLDGWIYGASGLFGGKIKTLSGETADLSGRDFRFRPETGEIEPASGLSQQGRIRDDFGNWFGNDNSTLLWHYPLAEHYMRRNPEVTYPSPRVNVSAGIPDSNRLFPISRALERYNDPQMADRVTGACGPEIYRDDLLGSNYYGNLFVCEPVHNLVTRRTLEPNGVTFRARRATNELASEFLASTDNWFRPVQARTGPDGALWIVDMYRFVIEHPRWIPTNRLRELDVRAGAEMGRIYRVYHRDAKPRPILDVAGMANLQLAGALDTVNGPTRDLIHQELAKRKAVRAPAPWPRLPGAFNQGVEGILTTIAKTSAHPGARVQATRLFPELYPLGLQSSHSGVRKDALAAGETDFAHSFGDRRGLQTLLNDEDLAVRFQLALSVGASANASYLNFLGDLILDSDKWLQAAVLSSARMVPVDLLETVMNVDMPAARRNELAKALMATAFATAGKPQLDRLIKMFVPADPNPLSVEALGHVASLLDLMERKTFPITFVESTYPDLQPRIARLRQIASSARRLAADPQSSPEQRRAGLRFYGLDTFATADDVSILADLLMREKDAGLQKAILEVLRAKKDASVAEALLAKWPTLSLDLRGKIVSLLLTRDGWALALTQAIERDAVSAAEIPALARGQLSNHKSADVRQRAAKLFHIQAGTSRAAAVSAYKHVASLSGRLDHGADVFERNCASCHAFRGRGHAVGPNLAEFAGKSVDDFVIAIIDPNAAIEPKHVAYTVELRDDRTFTGIIRGETASGLTVVQGGGAVETVLRSDMKGLRASPLSLMPEGLEQSIAPQEMADLITWLKQTAAAKFGSGTPEQTARARAEFTEANAGATVRILRASETLDYPSWMGRLPLAHCRQTDGKSRVQWTAPPIAVSNSVARFRFPAAMGFRSQPPGNFSLRVGRQHILDFDVTLTDSTWERTDRKWRMTYAVREASDEDSNGVLTIELAQDMLDSPTAATFEVTGSSSGSQRWFGIYLP